LGIGIPKKKLKEASHTIDQAEVRTRAIECKLTKVQEIPVEDSVKLIDDKENPA